MKEKKTRRFFWAGLLLIPLLAVLVAAGLLLLQLRGSADRFYPGTRVQGLDVSGLTASNAARLLQEAVDSRVCLLCLEGEELLRFSGRELLEDPSCVEEDAVAALLRQEHAECTPLSALVGCRVNYSLKWRPEAWFREQLSLRLGEAGLEKPVSSRLQRGPEGWEITPSRAGSRPLPGEAACLLAEPLDRPDALEKAAAPVRIELPLETIPPETDETDPLLNRQLAIIREGLASSPVTLDFGQGLTATFTPADLLELYAVELTESGAELTFSEAALPAVLDRVVDRAGGDGIRRKYAAIPREELHYNDWDTGFHLDREALLADTAAALRAGEGTVIAIYDYTASVAEHFGIPADQFIEISIENQYMWVYNKGTLVVGTPVRTGDAATGADTPTGIFRVSYRQHPAYLSRYNLRVQYWVPYFGNIGIHDASWVTEFGGDQYLTEGSHGCVNTPLEAMRLVYENCQKYSRVVVY